MRGDLPWFNYLRKGRVPVLLRVNKPSSNSFVDQASTFFNTALYKITMNKNMMTNMTIYFFIALSPNGCYSSFIGFINLK